MSGLRWWIIGRLCALRGGPLHRKFSERPFPWDASYLRAVEALISLLEWPEHRAQMRHLEQLDRELRRRAEELAELRREIEDMGL